MIYVDDLNIFASPMGSMKALKAMFKEYQISDLDKLCFCLGVEFVRDKRVQTITMNQSKYIMDVLK